jgi:CBS domain containing-hemolysin-like protein
LKKKETARKEKKHSSQYRWAVQVFLMAVVLSAALSLASQTVLSGAGLAVALLILAAFILLGIVFDVIGVAVTAADPKPFHSMASHKEKGAKESLMLLRSASSVSSVCNDVVGDICGIVSGTTGAVIVAQLQQALSVRTVLLSVAVTALISGLTIGGKALGKSFAMRKSTQVVYWVGRFLHLFHR